MLDKHGLASGHHYAIMAKLINIITTYHKHTIHTHNTHHIHHKPQHTNNIILTPKLNAAHPTSADYNVGRQIELPTTQPLTLTQQKMSNTQIH